MASGIAVTGGFSNLISRDFTRIAYNTYATVPVLYETVAKMDTADGNYIKEGEVAGFGKFPSKGEGQAVDFQIPKQGNNKTQYFTEFELGFQITRVMWEDDLTGIMKQMPRELSKAAAWTREAEFWNLLNNGFVNTYDAALDSYALFYDSHTNIDGADESYTTYDNNGTAGSLSLSTLQTGLDYFKKLKDNKGRPINAKAKWLIIPPDLEWKAQELLLSPYKPGTGDNDINTVASSRTGLQYLVVPYLTSTTAWFLLAADHDLRFIWRRRYTFYSWDDNNSGNAIFKGSMRFATTFFDPRLAFGNAGA